MDVVALNKNKIENCVANLGTALTERQILILNQFFNEVIICFDGDQSGYKAAVRAAESCLKELQPEKKISFLFYLKVDILVLSDHGILQFNKTTCAEVPWNAPFTLQTHGSVVCLKEDNAENIPPFFIRDIESPLKIWTNTKNRIKKY